MIRIYLIIAIIILVFFALRKFLSTPPERISRVLKKTVLWGVLIGAVFLAATGRLNWLFALAGVLIAFLLRMLPFVLRYVPQLRSLWMLFSRNKEQSSASNNKAKYTKAMSINEAYEVLGLNSSASKDEIILAHRKLIQKLHPDRGGSDYLASKINLAKKILLDQ